jgi:putative membrane protein
MIHFTRSLSNMSVAAVVLGLAACGGQSQAQQPPTTYSQTTTTSEQYGSTMGQTGAAGSTAAPPSSGMTNGQTQGTSDSYGSQSESPQYGSSGTAGAMGSSGMGSSQAGSPQYGSTGSTGSMGGAMDVSTLNDAQLAAVIVALDQGEIQEAQLAQSKALSADTKKFAMHMATAHQAMLTKNQGLFSQLQITPSENAVSQQLQSDAQNQLSTLQSMRGRDFDRDYVDAQIKAHNQALELIDRMIPNARNPQLKAALETTRPKIQEHLQEAERAQQKLQQGATNRQGSQDTGGRSSSPSQDNQR